MPGDGFNAIVAKKAVKSLRANRDAIISLFVEIEERVTTLPMEQSSVSKLKKELVYSEEQIKKFRSSNRAFVQAVLLEDADAKDSETFKKNQKDF